MSVLVCSIVSSVVNLIVANFGIIYILDFCMMHSSILIAIPVYCIANFKFWGICHIYLYNDSKIFIVSAFSFLRELTGFLR